MLAAAVIASSSYAQSPIPGADPAGNAPRTVKLGKLNPAEMLAHGEALDLQVKADTRHVLHLQAKARQEKDVIKLNCINDKLVQIKAQVNIFDTARGALAAGLESSTTADDKQVAFAEVMSTADAVKNLRAEADICVGEPELFKQESSSEVKRPEIPDDPGGSNPFGSGPFEAPAYASPFN